jgi:hypothetical protein
MGLRNELSEWDVPVDLINQYFPGFSQAVYYDQFVQGRDWFYCQEGQCFHNSVSGYDYYTNEFSIAVRWQNEWLIIDSRTDKFGLARGNTPQIAG